MDWATIVTGAVGVAGIGGALLSARMTNTSNLQILRASIDAEDARAKQTEERAILAEKRTIYANYLAACTEMLRVKARMSAYKADDPKGELPRELDEENEHSLIIAMSANAELELTAPVEVREPARELLDVIVTGRPTYGDARKQLMIAMRTDLRQPEDGAYQQSA